MSRDKQRPQDRPSWDQRYADGELPWDSGKEDVHLGEVIERHGIEAGKALEIGCGTGTNTIWLARQGFEMTGLDLAPNAVAKARSKVAAAGVACELLVRDFLVDEVPGGPFRFVYDRGVLHVFDTPKERSRFASRIAELLAPGGMWHSLIGSTDGPPRDTGPPRRRATEVVAAVEPHFEILELSASTFDRDDHRSARAWVLVARRRARELPEGGAEEQTTGARDAEEGAVRFTGLRVRRRQGSPADASSSARARRP